MDKKSHLSQILKPILLDMAMSRQYLQKCLVSSLSFMRVDQVIHLNYKRICLQITLNQSQELHTFPQTQDKNIFQRTLKVKNTNNPMNT